MALNDDKVRLFIHICDIEQYALLSAHTEQIKLEMQNWLETQGERRIVLFKDRDGKSTRGLIDLRRKLCSQYVYTGSCAEKYCALWHVCKRFIEGNCKGECGRSHCFRDKSNRMYTIEAGLKTFPDQLIRNIVAYSLPQVCLRYSNSANKCEINACPYLHICPSVVSKTACECSLSHNLLDTHNKKILEIFHLSHQCFFESEELIVFVLCNIVKPLQQKVCKLKHTSRSDLASPGSKTTSESVTSRKGEVSSIPPDPGSPVLQGSSSTSSVTPNPTSVTTKQTGLLLGCPTKMTCSNRSGNALTSQDCRSFSELHALKPDSGNYSESEKRGRRMRHKMKNLEGQVPNTRLSSNDLVNPELSNQTDGLAASNSASQDSRIVPDFHTSKDDALFRPEQEKREQMRQKKALGSTRSVLGVSTGMKLAGVPCISKDDRIPHHWSSKASNTTYARAKVQSDSSEFEEVKKLFMKTMKEDKIIDSFERVENLYLWKTYSREKEHMVALARQNTSQRMTSDIPCEKRLFHGTSPDAVDVICKQNFDWRVCGKSGTKYGEGSYFATNASYSHSYATRGSDGFRFMFLARVLVGSFIKGEPGYRRPPSKDPSNPSSDLYNSCVDDERNPAIFVIFDSAQVYPEYVIKYFTLEQDLNFQAHTTTFAGRVFSPIPHGALTGSASNLQKPVLPPFQGLTANPWGPSTSLSAERALSRSATSLLPPIAAPRSSQGLTGNQWDSSRSLSANKALSHSATSLLPPIAAPRSSQGLTGKPWDSRRSSSANRTLSPSASNLLHPLAAPKKFPRLHSKSEESKQKPER